jgi:hypothetical protein
VAAFDWRSYLDVAKSLATAADEASQRSAVSRAYYAVYHVALERAAAHGVRVELTGKETAHEACWMAFQTKPAVAGIGTRGAGLKVARHKADYRIVPGANWPKEATGAVTLAATLISELDTPPPSATAASAAYGLSTPGQTTGLPPGSRTSPATAQVRPRKDQPKRP